MLYSVSAHKMISEPFDVFCVIFIFELLKPIWSDPPKSHAMIYIINKFQHLVQDVRADNMDSLANLGIFCY